MPRGSSHCSLDGVGRMPYKEKRVVSRRELRARRILWGPTPLSQRRGSPHDDARGSAGCHHTPCEYAVERGEFVVADTIIAVVEAVNFGQALAVLLVAGPLDRAVRKLADSPEPGTRSTRRRRRVRAGGSRVG